MNLKNWPYARRFPQSVSASRTVQISFLFVPLVRSSFGFNQTIRQFFFARSEVKLQMRIIYEMFNVSGQNVHYTSILMEYQEI